MSDRRTTADLAALRREYGDRGLDDPDLAPDPIAMFGRWFDDTVAAGLHEPNAMVVTTVSREGHPSTRMVLLKGIDERGFVFYTNYGSRKGGDLAANPAVSLLFPWHDLQRQVRVEGTADAGLPARTARRTSPSRPRGSQLGAWASPQSQEVVVRAPSSTGRTAAPRSGSPPLTTCRCRRSGAATASGPTGGVLAGPPRPDARPPGLPPGGGALGHRLAWHRERRLTESTRPGFRDGGLSPSLRFGPESGLLNLLFLAPSQAQARKRNL